MKALSLILAAVSAVPLASVFSVTACASETQAEPGPAPSVEIEPAYESYLDQPQTPGTWGYREEPRESLGYYGVRDPAPPFVIRCDKENRRIGLARRSKKTGPLTLIVQTETTTRQLVANPVEGLGMVAADLDPDDPLLDAMAITKGRFVVGLEGEEALYIPAWVEVSRVIEDCR